MVRRATTCITCKRLRAELSACQDRNRALETAVVELQEKLDEALALVELQQGDIDRYKKAYDSIRPNTPERVPKEQLQLAFRRVLEIFSEDPAAQSLGAATNDDNANDDDAAPSKKPKTQTKPKNRHNHTRRPLDLSNLAVKNVVIDPDEVVAANGEGFELVGEEVSERLAFQPASYVRLHVSRRKWVRTDPSQANDNPSNTIALSPMVIAPVPSGLWPSFMADPSVVAHHAISKYADCLPLHRQEGISERNGFRVPRSTQCSWLGEGYRILYRIVDAMFGESIAQSFCIATDATGAPVRASGACDKWHIFVFIADQDHIVFRYSEHHTSEAMKEMLGRFRGHLLADAAPIYDILFHDDGATESACWFHLRRYFWRALASDAERALEILSLIAKLFELARQCEHLPLPEKTEQRAALSQPVLDVIDKWVEHNKDAVDARGPLDKGIGYYENQREALHRFKTDGRLRLDNSISEQQLRNAVLGRHNWLYFANETGLQWYTTYRSLIASCILHKIKPHEYLEQVLRLAPHWPVSRVLELSPKYWKSTLKKLTDEQQRILIPPWQQDWPVVQAAAPPSERADSLRAAGGQR